MKKTFQVRDLELIEKELLENFVGVLAVTLNNEKVVQTATTFLYLDKNVYIFFGNESGIYEDINLDINGSFIILKNESLNGIDMAHKYRLMSISISGAVKKVEEQKLLDELKKNYAKKYPEDNENLLSLNKALIIDSEEILALDEQIE
jgi:nitroimidazol reductase NimA-like FMN-containing flavoprotein (pyridoxamine 5'-phosphate oxidase superfamily)